MSIILQKRAATQKQGLISLEGLVQGKRFETFIMVCILCNAVTLGLETSDSLMAQENIHTLLSILDKIFIGIFTIEMVVKIYLKKASYFKDPWNVFDFLIVGVSWLPALGSFSVLRALRVLRVLRIISIVPSLRKVVEGLLSAVPGLGVVITILFLVFYISAVVATNLFKASFPEWFGNLASSAYSLFQVMTLESWSMGIVRPIMQEYPYAWVFFIPFIFITTFTMLNLFIGVIVNALQAGADKSDQSPTEDDKILEIESALQRIENQQKELLGILEKNGIKK